MRESIFQNDDAAVEIAWQLPKHSEIEVWQGARLVLRLNSGVQIFPSQGSGG
jgi:hypothetical protein